MRPSLKANKTGMDENGAIPSMDQGWAEAAVRQPLIPPGPKSA